MGFKPATLDAIHQAIQQRNPRALWQKLAQVRTWDTVPTLVTLIPLIKDMAGRGWAEGLTTLWPLLPSTPSLQHDLRRIVVLWALEGGHSELAQQHLAALDGSQRLDQQLFVQALTQRLFRAAETVWQWTDGRAMNEDTLHAAANALGSSPSPSQSVPVGRLWDRVLNHPCAHPRCARSALIWAINAGHEPLIQRSRGQVKPLNSEDTDTTRLLTLCVTQGRLDLLADLAPQPLPEKDAISLLWIAVSGQRLPVVEWLLLSMHRDGLALHEEQATYVLLNALRNDLEMEHEAFHRDLIERMGYPDVCQRAWNKIENDSGVSGQEDDIQERMLNLTAMLAPPELQRQWLDHSPHPLGYARAIVRERATLGRGPHAVHDAPRRGRLRS